MAFRIRHILGNPRDHGIRQLRVLVKEEQTEERQLTGLAELRPEDRQETRFLVFEQVFLPETGKGNPPKELPFGPCDHDGLADLGLEIGLERFEPLEHLPGRARDVFPRACRLWRPAPSAPALPPPRRC